MRKRRAKLFAAWRQRTANSLAHLEQHLHAAATVLQQVCVVLNAAALEQQDCGAAAKLEEAEFVAFSKRLLQLVRVDDGANKSCADANKCNLAKLWAVKNRN